MKNAEAEKQHEKVHKETANMNKLKASRLSSETKIEELKNEIEEKKMLLEKSLIEHHNLKVQILALEEQKSKATQESDLTSVKIEELSSTIQELQAKLFESETTLVKNRKDTENQLIEIICTLEPRVELLEAKVSTVLELEKEIHARDKDIDTLKKQMETYKNIAKKKLDTLLKKIEPIAAKERDNELSKISTSNEMRDVTLPPKKTHKTSGSEQSKRDIYDFILSDSDEFLADPVQVNRHLDAMRCRVAVSPLNLKRRATYSTSHAPLCLSQLDNEAKKSKHRSS